VHALTATFFGNLVDDATRRQGRISQQNWTLRGNAFDHSSVVNVRRCFEATFHLLQSKSWVQAAEEMCDFAGICSKLRAGEGFQLVRDLVALTRVEDDSRQTLMLKEHPKGNEIACITTCGGYGKRYTI
jgi:hypothetical protein